MNSKATRVNFVKLKFVAISAVASLGACASTKAPQSSSQALAAAVASGMQLEVRTIRSDDEAEDSASLETFLWQGAVIDLGPPELFTFRLAERGTSLTGEPMGAIVVGDDERERYLDFIVRNAGRQIALVRAGEVLMLGANSGMPVTPRRFSRDDDALGTPELDHLLETVNGLR